MADDQALVARRLQRLVELCARHIEVVGVTATAREAVEVRVSERPDVVLMDIRMPVTDGIGATWRIIADKRTSATRILIVTTFDPRRVRLRRPARRGQRLPAQGHRPDVLLDAVRVVAAGEALLAPQITRRLIEEFTTRPDAHVRAGHTGGAHRSRAWKLVLVARAH